MSDSATDDTDSAALDPLSRLVRVVGDDHATTDDIEGAFKVLAMLPDVRKVWKPAEIRLLNSKMTKLCQAFLVSGREIDLFRIFSVLKLCASPHVTKNHLGKLKKSLNEFPYFRTTPEILLIVEKLASTSPLPLESTD